MDYAASLKYAVKFLVA